MRYNRVKFLIFSFILIIITLLTGVSLKTGLLQKSKINKRDLRFWKYDDNGVIQKTEEFTLEGNGETCWYFIHGYTSTPDEFREFAERIQAEYDETVFVIRLAGCGEVPSQLLHLTVEDWYEQVSLKFDELQEKYQRVNMVGFSLGGALALRLAEKKAVHHLYLLSPYIFATYKWYRIFKSEVYLAIFADILVYSKKNKIAQIHSPEGLKKHISYWNMPFAPINKAKHFFEEVKADLSKVECPVLLQQSQNDKTSDVKSSHYIYENISSATKKIVIFEKSNHVIMADYDKKEVLHNIIQFENQLRR